jgi:hypothetical protein
MRKLIKRKRKKCVRKAEWSRYKMMATKKLFPAEFQHAVPSVSNNGTECKWR